MSGAWRSRTSRCVGAIAVCVVFDIAGAEAGYPPTRRLDAFEHICGENFHLTIHAGAFRADTVTFRPPTETVAKGSIPCLRKCPTERSLQFTRELEPG